MTNKADDESETTPLHGQFDVGNAPAHWHLLEQTDQDGENGVFPKHVENLDSNWIHLESFFATRKASLESKNLEGPPKFNISPLQSKSKVRIANILIASTYIVLRYLIDG